MLLAWFCAFVGYVLNFIQAMVVDDWYYWIMINDDGEVL